MTVPIVVSVGIFASGLITLVPSHATKAFAPATISTPVPAEVLTVSVNPPVVAFSMKYSLLAVGTMDKLTRVYIKMRDRIADVSQVLQQQSMDAVAEGEGDAQVVLTKASGTANDLNELRQKLTVIEKPVDLDKTHPYSQLRSCLFFECRILTFLVFSRLLRRVSRRKFL